MREEVLKLHKRFSKMTNKMIDSYELFEGLDFDNDPRMELLERADLKSLSPEEFAEVVIVNQVIPEDYIIDLYIIAATDFEIDDNHPTTVSYLAWDLEDFKGDAKEYLVNFINERIADIKRLGRDAYTEYLNDLSLKNSGE